MSSSYLKLMCLNQKNCIEGKISDHLISISGGVLFLNMMMQGKYNESKNRYNNGFAIIESDSEYQDRIKKVVRALAEALHYNPHVYAIGLAEAPVRKEDIDVFLSEAIKYPSLAAFLPSMKKENFTSWGVASFFDAEQFEVNYHDINYQNYPKSLTNRFQTVSLIDRKSLQKHELTTLHLPYDLAKSDNKAPLIQFVRHLFTGKNRTIVMGDFNINPKFLKKILPYLTISANAKSNILMHLQQKKWFCQWDSVDAITRNRSIWRNITAKSQSWTGFFNNALHSSRLMNGCHSDNSNGLLKS